MACARVRVSQIVLCLLCNLSVEGVPTEVRQRVDDLIMNGVSSGMNKDCLHAMSVSGAKKADLPPKRFDLT